MLAKIKDFLNKNISFNIFLLFFFIYFFFGLAITYHSEEIYTQRFNFIYNMDSKIVYDLFTKLTQSRPQHPLELITIGPFYAITKAFISSPRIAFEFLMAFCGSLSVVLIYSSINKLSQNKKFSIILSFIYGLSYSMLIFSTVPEIYIFSGFIHTLFLYYTIILYTNNSTISNKQIITLSLISLISFGINPINLASNAIITIWIICLKTEGKITLKLKNVLKFILCVILVGTLLFLIQKLAFSFSFYKSPFKYFHSPNSQINWGLRGTFVVPFYALKSYIETEGKIYNVPKALFFAKHPNFLLFIPIILFYFLTITNYITKIKNYKYNNLICMLLIPTIIGFFANLSTENARWIALLFSQNYLPYFMILISLLVIANKNKLIEIICYLFIICQIAINMPAMSYIIKYANETALKHYSNFTWIIYALITSTIMVLIKFALEKILNKSLIDLKEDKKIDFLINSYLIYCLIWGIFAAIFHLKG